MWDTNTVHENLLVQIMHVKFLPQRTCLSLCWKALFPSIHTTVRFNFTRKCHKAEESNDINGDLWNDNTALRLNQRRHTYVIQAQVSLHRFAISVIRKRLYVHVSEVNILPFVIDHDRAYVHGTPIHMYSPALSDGHDSCMNPMNPDGLLNNPNLVQGLLLLVS